MNAMTGRPKKAARLVSDNTKPDGLPAGFQVRANGVDREEEAAEGATEWRWLCSPLRVVALTRDRSGEGWGRHTEIIDADGRTHTWSIPARMLAGDGAEMRAEFLDRGLRLASGARSKAAFSDLLSRWEPSARALKTDRLGWTDESCEAFILGDGRTLGDARIVFQHEHGNVAAATEMREAGTVAEWTENVASLCRGNPLLVLAVSAAFAGPLLELLGLDGGGIHLRGASSSGKTSAQRLAASVWGSPRFVSTWRSTSNGLEGIAASCNSTILVLDELGEVNGRDAGECSYMLANGSGRQRADRTGRARSPIRWRVMFLSSGEIGLADKMAEAGRRVKAGQQVRLLDIAADTRRFGAFDELHGRADGAEFADALRAATASHFGSAGPAFIGEILKDPTGVKATARTLIEEFRAQATAQQSLQSGQAERGVQRLGIVAAAGELATQFGLTGWDEGDSFAAAVTALELWINGRGGAGSDEAREAIERTRAFLTTHGPSRFERVNEADSNSGTAGDSFTAQRLPVLNRAGWATERHYYIAVDAWREIHAGADPSRAAKYLISAGWLDADTDGRLKRRTPHSVPNRPRAYAVRAQILGAGDDV
ncbi:hypothetical protein DLJ53_20760 [Acuticoccus sediminis]|uniref:DUF927 domain-containing protein n=1 Tax=Acuticoccus sediminis TaxID=2184697 RepID=A0A8B2NSL8_9HYPH|nr:DUF927 domain-containing protein [Acuticoccus sediminis]RAI00144.1 hypothetical protein DLJ53_20760 [Acuticoccus sediminis]